MWNRLAVRSNAEVAGEQTVGEQPEAAVEDLYSPEGPVMVVPSLPGVPKFGVPLELKLTFCAMV